MTSDFEDKKNILHVGLPMRYGFDSSDVEVILRKAGLDPITPENIDQALELVKAKFRAAMRPPI